MLEMFFFFLEFTEAIHPLLSEEMWFVLKLHSSSRLHKIPTTLIFVFFLFSLFYQEYDELTPVEQL